MTITQTQILAFFSWLAAPEDLCGSADESGGDEGKGEARQSNPQLRWRKSSAHNRFHSNLTTLQQNINVINVIKRIHFASVLHYKYRRKGPFYRNLIKLLK